MYVCPDIAPCPGIKLLSLVWEVRTCEHLQRATHLVEVAIGGAARTDTMATQCMNDLFFHQAPAAIWRGTGTILEGKKRDARSYGTPATGGKQLGGINGGRARFPHELLEKQMRNIWLHSKISATLRFWHRFRRLTMESGLNRNTSTGSQPCRFPLRPKTHSRNRRCLWPGILAVTT